MKRRGIIFSILGFLVLSLVFIGCPQGGGGGNGGETPVFTPSDLEGKVLILQAYGNGKVGIDDSPKGLSHSFVELYNKSDAEISLDGIGLYYAEGTRDPDATEDGAWDRISLDGYTIPAGASFLIMGKKHDDTSETRYVFNDGAGDINNDDFELYRRGFKVALVESDKDYLSVQNPFNTDGKGAKVSGYIDMVGASNEYEVEDMIFGFEKMPARNSASVSVRRTSLEDTNNNYEDFESLDYRKKNGMIDELLAVRKPRASSAGAWDPFVDPEINTTPKLMILQVYGSGTRDDNEISHSFIELYNNTGSAIDLDNYSLHYAPGTKEKGVDTTPEERAWKKIDLKDKLPPYTSYLVRGKETSGTGALLEVPEGDIDEDFILSNRAFKVVLMSNQDDLNVANPFTEGENGGPIAGYVDMLGAINDKKDEDKDEIDAFEGDFYKGITRNQPGRRNFLQDSDNNADDFSSIRYKEEEEKDHLAPRASSAGAWDPVSGDTF